MDFINRLRHPGWMGVVLPIVLGLLSTFSPSAIRALLLVVAIIAASWTTSRTEWANREFKKTAYAAFLYIGIGLAIFFLGRTFDTVNTGNLAATLPSKPQQDTSLTAVPTPPVTRQDEPPKATQKKREVVPATQRPSADTKKPCVPASLNYSDSSLSTPPRGPNIGFIGAKGKTEISGGGETGYDVGVDDSCGESLNVKNFHAVAPRNDREEWFQYLLTQPLDRQTIETEIATEQATLAHYGRSIRPDIIAQLRKLEDDPESLKVYLRSAANTLVKPPQ